MILKLIAYDDEFHEEQEISSIEFRCDEVGLPEVIETLQDFLQACGWEFPEGFQLGYEGIDDA